MSLTAVIDGSLYCCAMPATASMLSNRQSFLGSL